MSGRGNTDGWSEVLGDVADVPSGQPQSDVSPKPSRPRRESREQQAGRRTSSRQATAAKPRRPVASSATVVGPAPSAPEAAPGSADAGRLILPRPEPSGQRAMPPVDDPDPTPPMMPVPAEAHFSSEHLVERLNEADRARLGDAEDSPRAYLELYITIAVVVLGVIGVIAYQFTRPSEAPEAIPTLRAPLDVPTEPSVPAPPADQAPAQPVATPVRAEPTKPKPKRTSPSSTPMLSIVTTPSHAIVSIDGVVYGRTPLIQPAPQNKNALAVTLKLDGHRGVDRVITRNEGGHFSLNVKLEPR